MKPFLNAKMAGLPRWAWGGLLIGGIAVGLYLKHSAAQKEENEGEEESEQLPNAAPQTLSSYEGAEQGGSLQGLGVAGPTPQATVPVEAPFLPEGITDALTGQGDTIQSLSNGVLESNIAANELAGILAQREPTERKEIIRERIGSAPKRKTHHKPPKKHKKHHKKQKK
jgi:hypothetical protein